MLALVAAPAVAEKIADTAETPALPVFKPRWWYHPEKLDARPVAWSLRNRPDDWGWDGKRENYAIRHKPSGHVFWIGSGPGGARLERADCSCSSTRGRFQYFQADLVFWPAYESWRLRQPGQYKPEEFAAHFVR